MQKIDTTAPEAPVINAVSEDDLINAAEDTAGFDLTGTGEAGATVTVSGFESGVANKTATVTAGGVWTVAIVDGDLANNGTNTLSALQTDAAGNDSPAITATLTTDTTAPTTPTIDTIAGNDVINASEETSTITGTTEAGTSVTLSFGDNERSATVTDTSWSYTLTAADITAMGQGTETITATATDAAGNATSSLTEPESNLAYTPTATAGLTFFSGTSLANINDDNISTVGTDGHQVHPTNADGKFIEFSFAKAYNLETFTFYNRTDGGVVSERIVGSTLEFFSGDTLLGTETITASSNIITMDISAYDNVDSVKLVFSGDSQNFREVDFSGIPTNEAPRVITVDTVIPTIATLIISGDDIVNVSDTDTAVAFSGTTSNVENNQVVTVVVGGVSVTAIITDNAFNGVVNLSTVADSSTLAVTATVSDVAGNAADEFTGTVVLDTTPPTVVVGSIPTINTLDVSSATIEGSAIGAEGQTITIDVSAQVTGELIGSVGTFSKTVTVNSSGDWTADLDVAATYQFVRIAQANSNANIYSHLVEVEIKNEAGTNIVRGDASGISSFEDNSGVITAASNPVSIGNIVDGSITNANFVGLTGSGSTINIVQFDLGSRQELSSIGVKRYSGRTYNDTSVSVSVDGENWIVINDDTYFESSSIRNTTVPNPTEYDLTVTATVSDIHGNETSDTVEASVELIIPTISITSDVSALKATETATITFTLSEVSTDFAVSDVAVSGGELSGFGLKSGETKVYTAQFTPTASSDIEGSISVASDTFTDAAGNVNVDGADANNTITLTIDTIVPTVTSAVISATNEAGTATTEPLVAGDKIVVTVVMSEPTTVTGTPTYTINVGDADKSATYVSGSGTASNTTGLTFSYTVVTGNLDSAGGITASTSALVTPTGVTLTDAAGNNATLTTPDISADTNALTVDAVAPTITSTTLSWGDRLNAVDDNTDGTVTVVTTGANGQVVSVLINGSTYTGTVASNSATITVAAADLQALADDSTQDYTVNVSDAAGNAAAEVTGSFTVDTTVPTVSISLDDSALNVGNSALVTFTFSEAPTGFTAADITAPNGTITDPVVTADNKVYTATFTPDADVDDADNEITVSANWSDVAGNAPVKSTSANYAVDTVAPTLNSSTAPTTNLTSGGDRIGDTIVLTVTFDGNVEGLTSGTNNTVFEIASTGVVAIWSGTNGTAARVLTYTVASGQNGQASLNEVALKAALVAGITDAAGNEFVYIANGGVIANIDVSALPVVNSTVAPEINTVSADNLIDIAEYAAGFNLTGTSEVGSTVTVTGATFAGGNTAVVGSAGTWSIAVVSGDLPENVATVLSAIQTDVAGNVSPATTTTITTDLTRPTLSAATAPVTALVGGGNSIGNTIALTITFDGDVQGLISSTSSTIFKIADTGVSATWSGTNGTATRILTYTVASGQNGQATLDEAALKTALVAGITDAAGNAFAYTANGGVIAIIDTSTLPIVDSTVPTVAITMDDIALKATETATVTFTFSETPTDFTAVDITSANGAISDLKEDGSDNKVYTATFTPTGSTIDATNVITVGTSWTDSVGNSPVITHSENYSLSTYLVGSILAGARLEDKTVILTMNEGVYGSPNVLGLGFNGWSAINTEGSSYSLASVTRSSSASYDIDVRFNETFTDTVVLSYTKLSEGGVWVKTGGVQIPSLRNMFIGTDGVNTIEGTAADDIIIGNESIDTLSGNGGSNTFTYTRVADANDIITDFNIGAGAGTDTDKLDLRDLLNFNSADTLANFVQFDDAGSGGDVEVKIDVDGSNNFAAADLTLTLSDIGTGSLDLSDFLDNLIVL